MFRNIIPQNQKIRSINLTSIPAEAKAAIQSATEDDRQYFQKHPHAKVRIRPIVIGECWPEHFPEGTLVYVHNIAPGIRRREVL